MQYDFYYQSDDDFFDELAGNQALTLDMLEAL